MTTLGTSNPTPAATLTEKELFAEFMESTFVEYDRLGRRIAIHYVPELLDTDGRYDYVAVDLQLHGDDDDPSYTLEMIEEELAGILEGVRLAREAFDTLKGGRLIAPPEPTGPYDNEVRLAWEKAMDEAEENPRYRPAAVVGETQEAA